MGLRAQVEHLNAVTFLAAQNCGTRVQPPSSRKATGERGSLFAIGKRNGPESGDGLPDTDLPGPRSRPLKAETRAGSELTGAVAAIPSAASRRRRPQRR